MSDWKLQPLGDVATKVGTGSTPSTAHQEFFGGTVQWFTPEDIGTTKELVASSRTITSEALASGKARLFERSSLLVTCIGEIGRVGLLQQPSSSNQQITAIKFGDDVDGNFAYYWFVANQNQLAQRANHALVPILNNERLKEIVFSYPLLPEQQHIAALLDRADRLRRLCRYAEELTASFLQAVFVQMFGDPVKNPMGWDVETLADLDTEFDYGTSAKSFSEPVGLPVLRIPNILSGEINLTDLKFSELPEREIEKLSLSEGEILFVRTNGNPDYVGRCAVFNLKRKCVFASYLIRAKLNTDNLNPSFILSYLHSSAGRKAMSPYIRTTAGQSNIGTEGLGQIPIPLPPLTLQQKFARIVQQHERLRAQQREATRQAEHLFQTLLHRAFNGTL